jgi:agmatinase
MGQPSPALQGDTFLRAARAAIDDLKPGDIAVLGVPHELTKISRPGTSAGPHAIRQATLLTHYIAERYCATGPGEALMDVDAGRVYRYHGASVYDLGDLVMTPDLSVNSERITTAVQAIAAAGALPVVLGGDHFLSLPSATGAVHGSDATTALLSLDMHLDLGDRVPDFGTHNGGTWLRRLIEDRVVEPEHVLIYGIESLQILDEWQYASRSGIQVITAHEVWERGVNDTLRPALDRALAGCNGLYATLDIDAGARSTVPGTGNQGGVRGLSPSELLEVCQTVQGSPLVGVDLTELSPPLDLSGATAGLAASMLVTVLWTRLFEEVSSAATDSSPHTR